MQSDEFEDHLESMLVTRPVIEQAKGVLAGIRCTTPEQAFEELRDVAQAHQVQIGELAGALVDVAAGRTPDNVLLRKVVWQEWDDLLNNC
jgi:AmiR/NasT family two-component response regulator